MAFWSNLISGMFRGGKTDGREKIAAKVSANAEEVRPEGTTAPKEFDIIPWSHQVQTDFFGARPGFYYEVRDAWKMYSEDDRVRSTIDSVGDDATQINMDGLPFGIKTKQGDEETDNTKEIATRLHDKLSALKVYQKSSDMIKFALLEGSRFYRIVVDFITGEITELRHIRGPKNGFVLVQIEDGEFKDHYVQLDIQSQQPVAVFLPWEIVRFDWNRPDESAYGMGLFSSARKNWKRLEESEIDMHVGRRSRAYAKRVREFAGASGEQLLQIRATDYEMQKRYGAESIETDIYTTGKVTSLDTSNPSIYSIEDIEYKQRRLFASGRRPVSLLGGYGKDA